MPKYICFLRAINVGGNTIIKMDALKKMFEAAGFKNVKTYIQSGNIVFDSSVADEKKLVAKVEKQIQKTFGFDVATFLRTVAEMEAIVKNDPFKKFQSGKEVMVYVAFFHEEPDKDQKKMLEALTTEMETYKLVGRELFCLCRRDTKGQTNFSNNFIEKKLKVKATTRNMNTVQKMLTF